MRDFCEVFESLLRSAITNPDENQEMVPDRLAALSQVFAELYNLSGSVPEMKLYPAFASGSVTAEVSELNLNKAEEALKLRRALDGCNTFEILPLTNGSIRVSATVKGIFKTTE